MEGVDDLDVGDAGELGALLGEASHVVAQGLVGLLATPFEVPGVPRAYVGALEVAHEDPDQVGPSCGFGPQESARAPFVWRQQGEEEGCG